MTRRSIFGVLLAPLFAPLMAFFPPRTVGWRSKFVCCTLDTIRHPVKEFRSGISITKQVIERQRWLNKVINEQIEAESAWIRERDS